MVVFGRLLYLCLFTKNVKCVLTATAASHIPHHDVRDTLKVTLWRTMAGQLVLLFVAIQALTALLWQRRRELGSGAFRMGANHQPLHQPLWRGRRLY